MSFQDPSPSSLLEQAHLAFMRGQFIEARMMLESLIASEPGNIAAHDLLAQVLLKQDSMDGRTPKFLWWRSISSKVISNLVVALFFIGFGIVQTVPLVQAGLAHGFGPGTTVTMTGNTGLYPHQVPIRSLMLHCCLPYSVGFVLLYVFFRQISDLKNI